MNEKVLDFLNSERVGVLAVEMPDGSPHGATIHFANNNDPFVFYFETNKTYRKAQFLLQKSETRASLVVGVNESTLKTLQLDGALRLITPEEEENYTSVYLGKFQEKKEKLRNPDFIRLIFIPTWWRFTDFTHGKVIITSEDK